MAVSRARSLGLKVYQGRLENAGFTDGLFDVVCLNHVLEHLPDPQVTMREIKRILKPDGIVYITVPNTRSLNF
ncbi:MAG: class I SAM-dependent methyltransferase [Deltaproteobacteria bacterium]|nr:class I SAM-dependent methyltransferase [Deltaproteobacteria bacterium]